MRTAAVAVALILGLALLSCSKRSTEPAADQAASAGTDRSTPPSSLVEAWDGLLRAMEQADEKALSAMSVPAQKPYLPLDFTVSGGEYIAPSYRKTAKMWRMEGVRWNPIEEDKVSGVISHQSHDGPPRPVMTGVCFVRVQGMWKFAGWKQLYPAEHQRAAGAASHSDGRD